MSSPGAAVNIPTFVADLPPSPHSRRQQNYHEPGAKCNTDTNNAKLNEGLRAASINAPIPSMILQESAEEEQSSSSGSDLRRRMPVVSSNSSSHSSDSVPSVHGAAVSASSVDVKTASSAATSVMPSAMVQVMLQLPGTSYQLPVNIPAETILPALTKYLPNLAPATSATTTVSSGYVTKPVQLKTDTGLTAAQPPASRPQPGFAAASRSEISRVSETATPQTKVPRLSNANIGMSSEFSKVSALPSSHMSSSVSDSDVDDNAKLQQTSSGSRNAASRCRQKKKLQVDRMETKAKELQIQNRHLEVEMRELQHDINRLQSLLQEHSDCFRPSSTLHTLQASHASDSA